MVKKRKSPNQVEMERQDKRERMSEFALKKKTEEQAEKNSLARQKALEKHDITQEFNYADHAEVYNYADHALRPRLKRLMQASLCLKQRLDSFTQARPVFIHSG
jgi:hypothetical protein